jgi:hypothetical protein
MDFPSVVTRYGLDTSLILAEGQLNDTVNLRGFVVIFTTSDDWSVVAFPDACIGSVHVESRRPLQLHGGNKQRDYEFHGSVLGWY